MQFHCFEKLLGGKHAADPAFDGVGNGLAKLGFGEVFGTRCTSRVGDEVDVEIGVVSVPRCRFAAEVRHESANDDSVDLLLTEGVLQRCAGERRVAVLLEFRPARRLGEARSYSTSSSPSLKLKSSSGSPAKSNIRPRSDSVTFVNVPDDEYRSIGLLEGVDEAVDALDCTRGVLAKNSDFLWCTPSVRRSRKG